MNGKSKILLIFTLVVLATGIGLVIIQPGSLGGDDDDETAQRRDPTTTVDDTDQTSSTTSTSTTAPAAGDGDGSTDTTQPGSGLGSSGAAQPGDTSDGLAATGGESLLLAGIALGTAGIAARRRPRRSA